MRRICQQFLTFTAVGAVGTAAHYAVLLLLVELARVDATVASTCGFIAGALVNYSLNYRFTFMSERQHREAAPRFAAVAAVGAALNTGVMYCATHLLGFHYFYSQLGATALVLAFNFTANRLWTFAEPSQEARNS